MVYYNPYIFGQYNPLYTANNQVFFFVAQFSFSLWIYPQGFQGSCPQRGGDRKPHHLKQAPFIMAIVNLPPPQSYSPINKALLRDY